MDQMEATDLKILQVIKGFDIGGPLGGAENFGINLSLQLARQGVAVSVCSFYRYRTAIEQDWCAKLAGLGIPVIFASEARALNLIHSLKILQDYCKKKQIDILHSHFQVASLLVTYLRLFGFVRRAIRTAHTPLEWGGGPVAWFARQIFTNWIYPLVFDAEVGVSEAIVDQLIRRPGSRLFGRQPIRIYNALSPEFMRCAAQTVQLGRKILPEGKFILGSVGRIVKGKGYETLLDVVFRLKDEIPQIFCVIIGEGELRAELEQKTKQLGITDHVALLGQRSDIQTLLPELDLFVLPSLMEGLSTVILESMACHVPVITTDIPGTRELIQDHINGWLVPPANPDALRRAILDAYYSPEKRKAFSQKAVLDLDRFSIVQITKDYLGAYRNI
jgi:glycosyltransferase involved in cell wall biosynthesis